MLKHPLSRIFLHSIARLVFIWHAIFVCQTLERKKCASHCASHQIQMAYPSAKEGLFSSVTCCSCILVQVEDIQVLGSSFAWRRVLRSHEMERQFRGSILTKHGAQVRYGDRAEAARDEVEDEAMASKFVARSLGSSLDLVSSSMSSTSMNMTGTISFIACVHCGRRAVAELSICMYSRLRACECVRGAADRLLVRAGRAEHSHKSDSGVSTP